MVRKAGLQPTNNHRWSGNKILDQSTRGLKAVVTLVELENERFPGYTKVKRAGVIFLPHGAFTPTIDAVQGHPPDAHRV